MLNLDKKIVPESNCLYRYSVGWKKSSGGVQGLGVSVSVMTFLRCDFAVGAGGLCSVSVLSKVFIFGPSFLSQDRCPGGLHAECPAWAGPRA